MNASTESKHHLRVGVVSESQRHRVVLRQLLEREGLDVVVDESLSDCGSMRLERGGADALVVDLDEAGDELLDEGLTVLEGYELPVLYHESGTGGGPVVDSRAFGRRLVGKLRELVAMTQPVAMPSSGSEPALDPAVAEPEALAVVTPAPGVEPRPANAVPHYVWALGASIGGPQAIKRFLAAMPHDVPCHIVVAQHIGGGFLDLLADQLNRSTALPVSCAREGALLEHGVVTLVPVDREFVIDTDNRITLPPLRQPGPYTPSIDTVFSEVARCFGHRAGGILFSGMGNDGLMGCKRMASGGGLIWTQDSESCVVSSMPDHVQRLGLATASGTPEALAARLVQHVTRGTARDADPLEPPAQHANPA